MQRRHTTPRASRGFTLVELMIVVAVIAILGAIAYPSYQEYVRKGRRGEARAALLELRQQQERYMTQFNTYKAFNFNENVPFKKFVGGTSETACQGCSHTLSAEACEGKTVKTCIKLIAEPVPLIPDPKVGSITLTSQGEKDCSGADKRKCWQ